jgi:hypothetical protein
MFDMTRQLIERENSRKVRYYIVVDDDGQIILLTGNKAVAVSVLKNGLK